MSLTTPQETEPRRCAECACEGGEMECNWIKPAPQEADQLRAENERLREALTKCEAEIDSYIRQEYPLDHPVHERYRQRDFDANPARAALASHAKRKEQR